ncbi:Lon protease [Oxobacter pfennigii]|uniref:endopeptidase La n=1 Tax=Oxobacter pfennigii TaxID=36849 RepID=A0A0P8W8K1_9CLOT|nr:ATP-binding protein [Oxobacter pfennigii]KPU44050.1 Lon protease [Oxobacter pfennigii]
MKKDFRVSPEQLLKNKYPGEINFRTTEDLRSFTGLIGQERAELSMKFGISIKEKGYNIYISGDNGTRRTEYAMETLKQAAKENDTPDDWCYVYNFESEYEPIALNFPKGLGKVFKHDMSFIVAKIAETMPEAFSGEEYDKQKNELLEGYQKTKGILVDELNSIAQSYGLQVKVAASGFAFVPVKEGKAMSELEYDNLLNEEKERITENISLMRLKAIEILRRLKTAEKEVNDKIEGLDIEMASYVVENAMTGIKSKYRAYGKVLKYFDSVKEDILKHIEVLTEDTTKESKESGKTDLLARYKVNLLIDNSETKGAPVIFESLPTYNNLFGNIEYESKHGSLVTDYLMIRAGSLLKSNGGYLIIKVSDILKNYKAWDGLKRVLNSNEIQIDGIRSQMDLLTINGLKPEAIPVDIKVILIGNESVYHLLYEYEEEFNDLFKIKVEFDVSMEKNERNIYKLASYLAGYCRKKNLHHIESKGFAVIIEQSLRAAENCNRISSCMEDILNIVEESNIWADISGSKYITRENVKKAIEEKKKRKGLIEDRMLRSYENKKIIIDVSGEAIGQINGLAVIESGGCRLGKPYRITASTYMGKSGIVNIEREVHMSGNIHNKSIMIIAGYLGEKYAKNIPLSLTAHICFEQLYGFIDGDSASIAELYAILSSLTNMPFKQYIAVTGSLNQMGEAQPVGGINEKIEGFHKICSMKGFNKMQGVIIPHQNVDDLILEDNVIADIKKGLFHIYAIKNVDEGIEILSGISAGSHNERGEFEEDTFNFLVDKRLKELIRNYTKLDETKQS